MMAEWISVEDRLPKPYIPVIVFIPSDFPHHTVCEGWLRENGKWMAKGYLQHPGKVVKWMPMPLPPIEYLEKYIKEKE